MSRADSSPVVSQGKRIAASAVQVRRLKGKRFDDSRHESSRREGAGHRSAGSPPRRPLAASPYPVSSGRPGIRPTILAGKNAAPAAKSRARLAGNTADAHAATAERHGPPRFVSSPTTDSALATAIVAPAVPVKETLWSGTVRVDRGRAGDHSDIYQMLLAVFHGPSREEFHAAQDDPAYEPGNRLLVKRTGRCVAHLQLVPRTILFGSLRLPADQLAWLVTLPEFRSRGIAGHLLNAANRAMTADGALLGMLRTRIPHFFRRWGWAVCGRHSRSRAKPRQILAHYSAAPELRRQPLNIRLWRHVELPALMRIYAQNTAAATGPLQRTEAYWRWLIGRKAFDHIIVALAGPDKLELNEATAPIVGYAVVRQNRVVELLADPAYPTAGPQLLARACADAIERDQHDLILESPPHDPLHKFLTDAGGQFHHHETDDQEVFMMRVSAPPGLCGRMAPV